MSQSTLSDRPYVNSGLFSGHYLDEKVTERSEWDCDEDAGEVMEELQSLYELEKSLVEGYGEDALIDNWINEVLDFLGYGTQEEVTLPGGGGFVDELLFETPTTRREAAKIYLDTENTTDLFERGITVTEAKQWDDDFTRRFSEQRPYRNASHQIKHYLENTTQNIQWGILTNGRKWRLYGTNDYETQTYYEVDLPELLEQDNLEDFKYFYVFFRPAAFRESAGTTFHDEVWKQSETASQELGEDLQDNVFTALRILGRGFIETNNLDIEPDDNGKLNTLKEQSLVLLYRLMFILYAESRGLIHPEGQTAKDTYEENFSLDELRLDIHETIGEVDEGFEDEYSELSRKMWGQLKDLFRLIDEGEESLGIPPYNGGLFNKEENEFLAENEVSNRYLAEVIYRLSTTRNGEGRFALADYSDLDTRHLGSVYEGLLEHQFRIASEKYAAIKEDEEQVWKPVSELGDEERIEEIPKNGLYVVNDEGKRKTTGAYYTPDYVVTNIVEENVGPRVDNIREDLIEQGLEPGTEEYLYPFAREVTDLRVLDPAMGSGHFLTKATGYLAEQVMEEVRDVESELGVAFDEQHVRRQIAKECIYGVDVNGMAVELAKLSMWLETLAADRPLAFLDHHLKEGNSLVGSDIEDVLSTSDENREGQQTFEDVLAQIRQKALDHILDLFFDLIDIENESISDVEEMKRVFEEIQDDPRYQHLLEMANVHTAERFGLDVPPKAYSQMAQAMQDEEWEKEIEDEGWFTTAQSMATEEDFFHWKLEFPRVFFNKDGKKKQNPGFDAVIGNPPYVSIENLEDNTVDYLQRSFDATESGRIDLYLAFIDQSNILCKNGRSHSMIVPDKWLVSDYGENLRSNIVQNYTLEEVWDLREENVFPDVSNSPIVYRVKKSSSSDEDIVEFKVGDDKVDDEICPQSVFEETYENKIIIGMTKEKAEVIEEIGKETERIRDFAYVSFGAQPGSLSKFVFNNKEDAKVGAEGLNSTPSIEPFIRGRNIDRFSVDYDGEYLLYAPDELHRPAFRELFENKKIVISEISSTLKAAFNGDHLFGNEKVVFLVRGTDLKEVSEDIRSQRPIPEPESISEFGATVNLKFLTTLLNSTLMEFYFENAVSDGLNVYPDDIRYLPIVKTTDAQEALATKCDEITELKIKRNKLNLYLPDYLDNYSEGPTLEDLSPSSPEGLSESILTETEESTDDFETLRVTSVKIQSDSDSITIQAIPYVKPKESVKDEYELNSRDYATLDPIPAMTFYDLSDKQRALIEAFIPYAVENEDGYTDNATKTISLIKRLKSLTLPNLEDVEDDLERYMKEAERAKELDEQIDAHYKEVDEKVYNLYGLDEEEIDIIEEEITIR